jgi:hypothetical protein
MTVPEIIEALTPYTGHFPEAAIKEAIAQYDAVAPHLLCALGDVAENPAKFASQKYMLHVFATYLLAQFRDKRAYRTLVRILGAHGEVAEDLFGDTITERLDNILASVYDGDPAPIKQLVEDEQVYEFVRGAAVDTFFVLAHTGQMPRQEVVAYYQHLFRGGLRREYHQVWNALACIVADLPAPELLEDLRKAYEDDLVDYTYADLEELEADTLVPFEKKPKWKQEKASLVSDAISEMQWWNAFEADDPPEPEEMDDQAAVLSASPPASVQPSADPPPGAVNPEYSPEPPGPGIRRGLKTGRNDPCPCGSGKKYKKCCLGQ